MTAAESRQRAKEDIKNLGSHIDQLNTDLDKKAEILLSLRRRVELYEQSICKEEADTMLCTVHAVQGEGKIAAGDQQAETIRP